MPALFFFMNLSLALVLGLCGIIYSILLALAHGLFGVGYHFLGHVATDIAVFTGRKVAFIHIFVIGDTEFAGNFHFETIECALGRFFNGVIAVSGHNNVPPE